MAKRTKIIIGFWIVFVILFVVSHRFLADIIMRYQQRPAIETNEAYKIITRYQQPVLIFYKQNGRCPTMHDKKQVIPEIEPYLYVKTIRLLADQLNHTCFISAVMRNDTPSADVKNRLITIAYEGNLKREGEWVCYTDITNVYTIKPCRDNPLPKNFLQALDEYKENIKQ